METTLTLARHFGTTPFVLFEQDTDGIIMIINHFISKGETAKSNTPAPPLNERDESAAFWAVL